MTDLLELPTPAMTMPEPSGLAPVSGTTPAQARGGSSPTIHAPGQGSTPTRSIPTSSPTSLTPVSGTSSDQSASASEPAKPKASAPVLADPMLALLADVLDDLERTRIANENRLRQLTRDEDDSDGINRGFGLTLDQPQAASVASLVDGLAKMEHQATLALQRSLRAHALGPWVKNTLGVGEKQGARLLAAIGDPYWNTLHNRPRTVSELWAYCGYHVLRTGHPVTDTQGRIAGAAQLPGGGDTGQEEHGIHHMGLAGVAPTRARGQRANWSATAKMRAYLIAEACMKCRQSPYRLVYDNTRAKYADAIHAVECRRCGPSGKPALPGSALSDGHKHARALRAVAKEVLRDLWVEAKRLHEETT